LHRFGESWKRCAEPVQAQQQIVSRSSFRSAAFGARLFQARQVAMPGETFAQGLEVAGVEGLERGGQLGSYFRPRDRACQAWRVAQAKK
jgi:hypothetical protein